MKTTVLSLLVAGCLLAAAAWFVQSPKEAQAVAVPEQDRETIRKGLDYLAGKQFKDGHWEGDGGTHPVAMTGLAGLAFLMSREDPDNNARRRGDSRLLDDRRSAIVRKAADWLIAQSQAGRDGLIFSGHESETSRYMLGHGLATMFLAGVCQCEQDEVRRKKLTEVLERAVAYIARAQSTQGGWHDTSKAEGHDFATIQATAIQIEALRAAENANISVPGGIINDGLSYLMSSMQKECSPADTAAALACLSRSVSNGAKADLPSSWVERSRSKIPAGREFKFGRDELGHSYLAQLEFHLGGETWKAYRTPMFEHLRTAQDKDGAWPAAHGTCVGQVYAAAVWCTILQLDNNSHPSRQRLELVIL